MESRKGTAAGLVFPATGQQDRETDCQYEPNSEHDRGVAADYGENESIFNDRMTGCEKESHQEQFASRQILFLGNADDDPRAIGDAEENPGKETEAGCGNKYPGKRSNGAA